MQNLRYKLLFIACALFTGVHTLLGVNASEHYTFYTREFLRNLGVRNPNTVPVRRIDRNDQFYDAAGYADGNAIHLNEDIFANSSEACNLFTCAHEAAHHALGHAFQGYRNRVAVEQEADETAARMLCTHGFRYVVEEEARSIRTEDNDHPTNQQRQAYLRRILGENGYNPGQERNPGRGQDAGRAGRGRNGAEAGRNAGRTGNNPGGRNNTGRAGRGRNGADAGRNAGRDQNVGGTGRGRAGGPANPGRGGNQGSGRNADRDQNAGRARDERNRARPERNQGHEQNTDNGRTYNPERTEKTGTFEDLWNQFNDLSRTQKLVIAGILALAFIKH